VPSREEHLEKAAANAELATDLGRRRRHPDWAVTARFYQALHLLEAHFAASDIHHASHAARDRRIAAVFPQLVRAYVDLGGLARNARYGAPLEVGWLEYEEAFAHLARIEGHLRPLL
jgi:hypothetical protein